MKILKYVLAFLLGLIVVVVACAAGYAAYLRSADAKYHVPLARSFEVTSTDFQPGQELPIQYSCRGAGISPQIRWSGAPDRTKSFALITTDWDAPSPAVKLLAVTHWVLYNIPASVTEIAEKAANQDLTKNNISVGLNISGAEGYAPPCPPFGTHQYIFRVYALDVDKIQPSSNTKPAVMNAMQGHILGYGELIGLKSAG